MNELSIEEQETAYAEYVESLNQDLRKEGAEELRQEIIRELDLLIRKSWTQSEKIGYMAAKIVVERAAI
jgi:hypothetical protein